MITKLGISLLLAVSATPISKHEGNLLVQTTDDHHIYIATSTNEACEQPALGFFDDYVKSGVSELWTAILDSEPTNDEMERYHDFQKEPVTPMQSFWRDYIRGNMSSYNVIQTGPNTFTFFCKFKHWTLDLANPFAQQKQPVRYRMKCHGHILSGEYFGRINFQGTGSCDLEYPLPEWRKEYLLALEEAEIAGKTVASRAGYHQRMWIDSLKDDLAIQAEYGHGK